MLTRLMVVLAFAFVIAGPAGAATCAAYSYNLTNGTTADAAQVMGNFNSIQNCVNNSVLALTGGTLSGALVVGGGSQSGQSVLTINGNANASNTVYATSPGNAAFQGTNTNATGIGVQGIATQYGGYGVMGVNQGNGYGVFCNAPVCGGNAGWNNMSDERIKTSVRSLPEADGLDAILRLRPVRFHFKDKSMDKAKGDQIGFLAQDVEKVFPEFVTAPPGSMTINLDTGQAETVHDVKGLSYAEIVAPLVKAVQQLKTDNDNLRNEFDAYKAAHP